MTLKEARYQAIEKAESLFFGETICIYRTKKREFELEIGITPFKEGLVQMISAEFVQNGWYKKYHPDYFRPGKITP